MIGQLTPQEVDELLMSRSVGRIGCHGQGKTLVVPVTYAYDGKRIIGHSAVGEKVILMRANPNVCFEVDQIDDLRHWRSVIVQGQYHELSGDDASVAMSFLVEKVMPMFPSETAALHHGSVSILPRPSADGHPTVVFCIDVVEKTGRFER